MDAFDGYVRKQFVHKAAWCSVRGLIAAAFCLLAAGALAADVPEAYSVLPDSDVVGEIRAITASYEDTLLDIARNNDLGYNEITAANPGLDPWIPGEGEPVAVPGAWVLPDAPREGIVLNLAEMRLFRYFMQDGGLMVETYPIGVGRDGSVTELGVYKITGKEENPSWFPPKSIRDENPELPEEVPPGPDNPLGAYKMRLGSTSYMIHGTNRPWGVGRRVSHGCIRLYPEDISRLFPRVMPGEKVNVVYQPVKIGLSADRVMAEFHKDYLKGEEQFSHAVQSAIRRGLIERVDVYVLYEAAEEHTGMPVDVTATSETQRP